jgi:TPR repeat protein
MLTVGSFIRYYLKCSADLYINDSAVGFNQSVNALLLANQHRRGLGVIKDETEAARLLLVAADGFKEAARVSHDPGLCYKVAEVFFAEDRIKDERLAARYYLKATMLGHPGAIDRLLERYAKPLLGAASVGAGNLPAYLDAAFVYSVLNVCAAQPASSAVAADQRDLIAQRFGSSAGFDEKAAQLESRRLLTELKAELKR